MGRTDVIFFRTGFAESSYSTSYKPHGEKGNLIGPPWLSTLQPLRKNSRSRKKDRPQRLRRDCKRGRGRIGGESESKRSSREWTNSLGWSS